MKLADLLLAVLLIATLAESEAYAQAGGISGVVIDARTERPLAGVIIAVAGQSLTVETDAEGRFHIDLPQGRYLLSAALVGYAVASQPLDVATGAPLPVTIRLSEGAGAYEELVTVTGAAHAEADAAPAGASLYGRELQALRGVTLDDPMRALHALPSATATDDFYSEFAVRGSPFRSVGLTVDGIASRYLMHAVNGVSDGGSIAMVNSDAVGSVSLMPGSYPEQIGRSLGGQVDLTLREGDRGRKRARAGLSGTSAAMVAEGPIGNRRGSWLVSMRKSYLDYLLRRIDEENSFGFGFTDVEAKAVFDLTPRNQLQALIIGGASTFREAPEGLGLNDEARSNGRTWLSALTWRFTPTARFVMTQRLYTTGLSYKNINADGGVLDDSSTIDGGWRADARADLGRAVVVESGGDAQRLSGRHARRRSLDDQPDLTVVSDYSDAGFAGSAYVRTIIKPVARLLIAPGVRMDHWGPTTSTTVSPWLTADWSIAANTRVRAGGGTYRQFADFETLEGVRGGGGQLRPETARHLDLGLAQTLPRGLVLQVTGYARDESGILWAAGAEPRRLADGSIQLGRADARWTNALDGRARGVEVLLRRDAPSGLSGWAGYAYGRHDYADAATGESFAADYDQRHSLSLFGHYRISNRTTVGAKFRYGSNYPLAGYIDRQPLSPNAPPLLGGEIPVVYGLSTSRNTLRLPAYARLDIRADRTVTWLGRRVTIFGEVANVLDRQNVRNVPYGIDRAGHVLGPTDSLLPIVPTAGFVIEF